MTPQERQLVNDLFQRLASLENQPRDPEAERLIADGLTRAPNAIYPLVQTVLVQDEALKRAHERIRALEGSEAPHESPGFLDSMRDAFFGREESRRGSVPSVPPASKWGSGQTLSGMTPSPSPAQAQGFPPPQQPEPQRAGGSFLGTAGAAAAGVIGGSLLLNSIQSLLGGHQGQAFGAPGNERPNPWGGNDDASRSDMAREAGLDDVGSTSRNDRQAAFDNNQGPDDQGDNDSSWDNSDDFADADDFGGDFDDGGE